VDEEEIQGAELREVQRAILEAHGVVGLGPVLGVADVVHDHAIPADDGEGQRRYVRLPVRSLDGGIASQAARTTTNAPRIPRAPTGAGAPETGQPPRHHDEDAEHSAEPWRPDREKSK